MSHTVFSPRRRCVSRRAVVAAVLVAGLGLPASSVLMAAGSNAVDGAALSTGLQPAQRLGPGAATTVPPTTQPKPQISPAEQRVLDLTNAERTRRGIAPLSYHVDLATAAAIHGNDQRNKPCSNGSLTHTGTDGSNTGDRIKRTGLQVRNWAENIACGFPTARAVVDGWMASPGHRTNILNPQLTHIGVSLTYTASGSPYWVQVFALPR